MTSCTLVAKDLVGGWHSAKKKLNSTPIITNLIFIEDRYPKGAWDSRWGIPSVIEIWNQIRLQEEELTSETPCGLFNAISLVGKSN